MTDEDAPDRANSDTPAEDALGLRPSAPTEPRVAKSPRRAGRSSTTLALAGAVVVLALALAGALGFLIGRDGGSSETQRSGGPEAAAPAKLMTLREAVELVTAEGERIESMGSSPAESKAFVERWMVPSCAAFINGMVEAFGGDDQGETTASGTTSIISVDQRGDAGTVVTETDGERETQQWVRTERGWQLSCAGMFGDESADDAALTPTTTPQVAEEPAVIEPEVRSVEPYVVECLQGTPGPAQMSDGTVAFSQKCFDENGGEAYMSAERQSGPN